MSFRAHVDRLWPSLVALAGTVAVVLGLLYMFGADGGGTDSSASDQVDDAADPDGETSATPPPSPPATDAPSDEPTDGSGTEPTDEPTETDPVTAPPELRIDIGVLNATSVAGLAADAEVRFEEGGWIVTGTGNYTSGDVAEATIYYPSDEMRESAEAFAAQFPEVVAVEPTPVGANLNRQHPVVVLTQDYADAIESQ